MMDQKVVLVLRIELRSSANSWNALVVPFAGTADKSHMDIPKVGMAKKKMVPLAAYQAVVPSQAFERPGVAIDRTVELPVVKIVILSVDKKSN